MDDCYYSWDMKRRMHWVTPLPDVCESCGASKEYLKHAEYRRLVADCNGKPMETTFISDQAYICTECGFKSVPKWGTNVAVIAAGMGCDVRFEVGDKIIEQWTEWEPIKKGIE